MRCVWILTLLRTWILQMILSALCASAEFFSFILFLSLALPSWCRASLHIIDAMNILQIFLSRSFLKTVFVTTRWWCSEWRGENEELHEFAMNFFVVCKGNLLHFRFGFIIDFFFVLPRIPYRNGGEWNRGNGYYEKRVTIIRRVSSFTFFLFFFIGFIGGFCLWTISLDLHRR